MSSRRSRFLFALIFIFSCVQHPAFAEEGGTVDSFEALMKKRQQNAAAPTAAPAAPAPKQSPTEEEPAPVKTPEPSKKKKKDKEKKKKKKAAEEAPAASTAATPTPTGTPTKNKETAADLDIPVAPKDPSAPDPTGRQASTDLIVKANDSCYVIEFGSQSGEIISCSEALPIHYTKRDCTTHHVEEIGNVDAVVSCKDSRRFGLRFRTSHEAVVMQLRVNRTSEGRSGTATRYRVESASIEKDKVGELLPAPTTKPTGGETPEESPIKFKFSGFAFVEQEQTSRFGYNVGTATQVAQPNFTNNVPNPTQNNTSLFSNINFELNRDRTSLVSTLEIGEIYYGDLTSGGAQGGRAPNVLELRNFYLSHELNERYSLKGGIITTASDPRAFVFSDQIASLQANFKNDLSEGLLWYGNGKQNRPGASRLKDQYLGISGSLQFLSGIKHTLFGVYRTLGDDSFAASDGAGGTSTVAGDSHYVWLGGTFDYDGFSPVAVQLTAIANGWWFRGASSQYKNTTLSYLLDGKVTYTWARPQVNFTLEGLATPGASGVTDAATGRPLLGTPRGFVSPVGASYLLTVATNDGVDDAVGTPKQSIIADLNQAEGLRMLVFTTSVEITKRATVFARYGYIGTAAPSDTGSGYLGQEVDAGAVYQVTPSTSLQADYGRFQPGTFFSLRDFADLASLKMKFNF